MMSESKIEEIRTIVEENPKLKNSLSPIEKAVVEALMDSSHEKRS